MKKFNILGLLTIILAVLVAGGNVYSGDSGKDTTKDKAAKLWQKIQNDKYTENYKFWPGKDKMYEGTHPHGAFLNTYLNDTAYKGLKSGEKTLPYGSIVIKENYMPDKKLAAVTVMKRVKDFNPEAGDWYWVKYKPNGEPHTMEMNGKEMPIAGKAPGCIGCHSASVAGIDYIMTPVDKK